MKSIVRRDTGWRPEIPLRRTLADISELPQGRFEAEGFVDFDGFSDEVVNLKVAITISAGEVLFDRICREHGIEHRVLAAQ